MLVRGSEDCRQAFSQKEPTRLTGARSVQREEMRGHGEAEGRAWVGQWPDSGLDSSLAVTSGVALRPPYRAPGRGPELCGVCPHLGLGEESGAWAVATRPS